MLEEKVCIVTGASRGIGEAIARSLHNKGARVVLAARKIEALEKLAGELGAERALAVAAHTGKLEDVTNLIAKTIERFGKVDVLVNNAATNPHFGPMIDIEWGAYEKTFEVNCRGYFAMTRAVAQHLIDRSAAGSIINIASIVGMQGSPLQGVYAMTKAAVISMTKTLAIELGSRNIRINAIAPGFIKTRFAAALVESEEISTMLINRTPLGRIGRPDEIGELAAYLAGDASSFVTGSVFTIDGGFTAGLSGA
jgi:NAD(P)-dependent dehydrogenase (short-subunit alcohol dehydrogenase family)